MIMVVSFPAWVMEHQLLRSVSKGLEPWVRGDDLSCASVFHLHWVPSPQFPRHCSEPEGATNDFNQMSSTPWGMLPDDAKP